jgi:hypothetical protein
MYVQGQPHDLPALTSEKKKDYQVATRKEGT